MKNIFASLLLSLIFTVATYAQPQRININDNSVSYTTLKSAGVIDKFDIAVKNARPFALNPMVRNHNNVTIGDTLQLALFPGKEYLSVIQSKTTDVNGTTVLVAKLTRFQFAWGFISIADQNVLITVDIPERNEKYTTRQLPQNRVQYLVQLDETKLDILPDGQIPSETTDSLRPNGNIKSVGIRKEDLDLKNADGLKSAQLAPGVGDSAQIDILVVYTSAAKQWADTYEGGINNTISLAMAKCNLVSENSKLGIKFNLVHSTEIDYVESGDSYLDINNLTDGIIPNVYAIRDIVAADIVMLFANTNDFGGMSKLLTDKNGNEEFGYSVTRIQQASGLTTIHEIGHNLGAHHHRQQSVDTGPTIWNNWSENTWSAGWRWKGGDNNYYCDVMTYEAGYFFSDGITHTQIPYFSDPDFNYQGQPAGHVTEANNARTIRETKHVVAAYRKAQTKSTPTVYTVVVDGITKNGATSGGYVVNEGASKVTGRGIVWGRKRLPTLIDNFTEDGQGNGFFPSHLTGLLVDSVYYVRAYATNSAGTAYGNQVAILYSGDVHRDFITRWELPPGQDKLEMIINRSEEVAYKWETVPAGKSGSGTFSKGNGLVKIQNLPDGQTIRVGIAPENLKCFYSRYQNCPYPEILGTDRENLIDVEQWGTARWNDMKYAFHGCSRLNISASDMPDLSKVQKLSYMFSGCKSLNKIAKINNWPVSSVTDMSNMFYDANTFNQYIGDWDVSLVKNMDGIFSNAKSFNQDLSKWNVSNVSVMRNMFLRATSFNQNIGKWDVSNVADMSQMFAFAESFNQNIGGWDVSNVINMGYLFSNAISFNQDIGRWDVSNVIIMYEMFQHASVFNQNIGAWNVSKVVNMEAMFSYAGAFNQDIGSWNVSSVFDMNNMFATARNFNQDIENWDVSKVTNMEGMFWSADAFNQNIESWDVSKVKNMRCMFRFARDFNQDISGWDVSNATNMSNMFETTRTFNQNLGNWNLSKVNNLEKMFDYSGMDCYNYSATLSGWNANANTPDNLTLGAQNLQFGNNSVNARTNLTTTKKWSITGDAGTGTTCDFKTNLIANKLSDANLKLFPNPVTNELILEIEDNFERFNFQIINATGQAVYKGSVIDKMAVQTGSFAPGLYLLRFDNNTNFEFKKIIKK